MTRGLGTLPLAMGWTLVLIASVVGLLVAAAFVLWVIRYLKDRARLRLLEKEYADAWLATHRASQHVGRYEYDVPGRPE